MWGKIHIFRTAWTGPCQGMTFVSRWIVLMLLSLAASSFAAWAGRSLGQAASEAALNERARLLFFTAPWCAPCHRIQPVLAKICRQNRAIVELVVVDYDESPLAVEEFAVESIPTMLLLDRSGKLLIRVNGASKEGLDALFAEIKRLKKAVK